MIDYKKFFTICFCFVLGLGCILYSLIAQSYSFMKVIQKYEQKCTDYTYKRVSPYKTVYYFNCSHAIVRCEINDQTKINICEEMEI